MKRLLFLLTFLASCNSGASEQERRGEKAQGDSEQVGRDRAYKAEIAAGLRADSLMDIRLHHVDSADAEYKTLVRNVEKAFWKGLRDYDYHSYIPRFRAYFKKSKHTPYELYVALTEAEKLTRQQAEAYAEAHGRRKEWAYEFVERFKIENRGAILKAYKIPPDLLSRFADTYCDYIINGDSAIKDGYCRLPNREYWQHHSDKSPPTGLDN